MAYKREFTLEQREKFQFFLNEKKRKKAMQVFQYIWKYQSEETGFLEMSLDRLYKKFSRYNKGISPRYFIKLANELVEVGLLQVNKTGGANFYGLVHEKGHEKVHEKVHEERVDESKCTSQLEEDVKKLKYKISNLLEIIKNNDIREYESIIEEDEELREILESEEIHTGKAELKEKIDYGYEMNREEVIDLACDIMEEHNLHKGSTPYMQVIESLHTVMDNKPINFKGARSYIEKTIWDKVSRQAEFSKKLAITRKFNRENLGGFYKKNFASKFNNFEPRRYDYNRLEKQLLGEEEYNPLKYNLCYENINRVCEVM
ncbi:MAG: hypothetical protein ACLR60_11820 [Clostridium paraputrificum]